MVGKKSGAQEKDLPWDDRSSVSSDSWDCESRWSLEKERCVWEINNTLAVSFSYQNTDCRKAWMNEESCRRKWVNWSYEVEKVVQGGGRGSWWPEAGMLKRKRSWICKHLGSEQPFFPWVLMVPLLLSFMRLVYLAEAQYFPNLFSWACVSSYFSMYLEETDWQRCARETH